MKQQLATSRSAAVSYKPVLGVCMKLTDVGLLTLCLCALTMPSGLSNALHHPAYILALRVPVKGLLVLSLCALFWTSVLHSIGAYDGRRITNGSNLLLRLYTGIGICSVMTLIMLHLRNLDSSIITPLLSFFVGSYMLAALSRGLALCSDRYVRPMLRETRRTIIVGTGERSRELSARLSLDRQYWYDVVGYVDSVPVAESTFAGRPILGTISDLQDLLMREHIDEVLIALPVRSCYEDICEVLQLCEASGVRSQYLSDQFATSVTKRRQSQGDNAERVVFHMVHSDLRQIIKRSFDVAGALIGLLLLSPLMLLIAGLIKATSPGPVFFSQVRYGLNKRRFPMFKFRSMVPDAEQQQAGLEHLNETGGPVFKIKEDPRITPIGRLLRKTSLDELPQLWNVLRGEMSLVGPRPLPMRDVSNFAELSLVRRFSVKPGMTGLWQVSGRSSTSFDGWIKLDLYYIDHWSLLMDARILMRTLPAVLRGSGAS
ncbi:sugar transferase [Terriglobus aquaticus]|uniref:Sugar transferase n=1 Tax=Terriglobus aquaticus TaxID=940139 RepID=A0ABW9KIE4_9BACT|nr:sugar transferase [Terriglobus aquaticus]